MRWPPLLASLLMLLALHLPLAAQDMRGIAIERRVALVIGNQDYRGIRKLENAVADARGMAAQLRERGFQVFDGYDLDRRGMNRLIAEFEASLAARTIAVAYYAGHGVQVGAGNVLIPVDATAQTERELTEDGIRLAELMERMAAANAASAGGFNLLIVDACRDNPFRTQGRSLGLSRGLTATGTSGVMVLYAAGTNQQALDRLGRDDRDPNGLFTRVLLRTIRVPGLSVREVIGRVRTEVATAARGVGHDQTPAIYDEAIGDFVFTPAPPVAIAAPAVPATAAPGPPPIPAFDRDALAWQSIAGSRSAADFQAYLEAFPNGVFAPLARSRIAALSAPVTPPVPAPPTPMREAALTPQAPAPLPGLPTTKPLALPPVPSRAAAPPIPGRDGKPPPL
ncbi:caspase family protein, partial [Roseomonas hellenica]